MPLKDLLRVGLGRHEAAPTNFQEIDGLQHRDTEDQYGLHLLYDGTKNRVTVPQSSRAFADDAGPSSALSPVDNSSQAEASSDQASKEEDISSESVE